MPTTWPEFFAVADKLKAAGIQPVAMGGQPWQDLTLGKTSCCRRPGVLKKALVDLDQATLTSPQMLSVFDTVRKIQGYFDTGRNGRDWNLATAMVINGKAGMQFMGDWAKGEFENAGKKAGKDYVCAPVPGTANSYTFNVDSFVFFQQKGEKNATPGQLALAKTIMTPDFQEQFSLLKGSVPVRLGVKMDKFDDCAKKSYADEQTAIKSAASSRRSHGMAQSDATAGAITDVVTKFMNSQQDSKSAVAALAKAAKVVTRDRRPAGNASSAGRFACAANGSPAKPVPYPAPARPASPSFQESNQWLPLLAETDPALPHGVRRRCRPSPTAGSRSSCLRRASRSPWCSSTASS